MRKISGALLTLLLLTACAGVSTGVRSPCADTQVSRSLGFAAVAVVSERSGQRIGANHGCYFQDF